MTQQQTTSTFDTAATPAMHPLTADQLRHVTGGSIGGIGGSGSPASIGGIGGSGSPASVGGIGGSGKN